MCIASLDCMHPLQHHQWHSVLYAKVQFQLPKVFVLANKPPKHQLWHGSQCALSWLTASVISSACQIAHRCV